MPRRFLVPLILGLSLLVVPASAPAATNIAVGIGNQQVDMFASPLYQALKLKKTRYFIEWNAIDQPAVLAKADAFVAVARAAGVKVLMHISADDINRVPRRPLPSVSKYRTKVKKLIQRYKPLGVTDWGAWNEANHKTQPTDKKPKRAAQFFKAMRSSCSGCNIVALDVLDEADVKSYINGFYKALGRADRKRAKIVGIHNYTEVNRRRTKNTRGIIAAVRAHNRSAKFWYTETGGLNKLGSKFPCDPVRGGNRTRYMFTLAKRFKKFVRRLYIYNWTPTPVCVQETRFDSGVVNPDGTARPAYNVIKSRLSDFKR